MPIGDTAAVATPGRHTRVTFNRLFPVIIQRPVLYERRAREIARGSRAIPEEVVYSRGLGLMLRAHQFGKGNLFERTPDIEPAVYRGAMAVVAPDHHEQLVSVLYNYPDLNYVDIETKHMPMYHKKILAGDSWEKRLTADQVAFPSPEPSRDPIGLDRVFISTENHKPDQTLIFSFVLPDRPTQRNAFGTAYFTGIPGRNAAGTGVGQYAAKLMFDGNAILFERCIDDAEADPPTMKWVRRFAWQWCESPAPNMHITFAIQSNATESCSSGQWAGSRIWLKAAESYDANDTGFGVLRLVNAIAQTVITSAWKEYEIPYEEGVGPSLAPVRLDLRRDIRTLFQVTRTTYVETVTFRDDPFEVPVFPGTLTPFVLEWYGDFPEGTSAECKLYFAGTNVEVPHIGMTEEEHWPVQDCLGGVKIYPCTSDMLFTRAYEVEITLNAAYNEAWDAYDKTPILRRYRVRKNGVTEDVAVTPLVFPTARAVTDPPQIALGRQEIVDELTAEDGQDDPASESATVSIADFTNEMPELQDIVAVPCDVDVYDDDDLLLTRLARFHVSRNESHQIRGERAGNASAILNQYPKPGSRLYTFSGTGEWTRLQRSLFPEKFFLTEVYTEGTETKQTSMKVTDGLGFAIEAAGYPTSMIDVPDLPVRFWTDGGANDESLLVEAYSPVGEFVVQNARDFLGGWPVFDLNAGADGMWRILQQKRPPYNNLMRFTRLHPGAKKLPHLLASYPIDTGDGIFAASGQLVPHNYITDEQRHLEPPEGNCVITHGGYAEGSPNQGSTLLSQFVVNPVSFNVLGLAPGHPFYPDTSSPEFMGGDCVPIVVMDGTLKTREALNWVTRRVFDYACYARRYLSFVAPLRYIIDDLDPLQTNPRKLRFGDPVQVMADDGVSWEQWLVVKCSPMYEDDKYQMARYGLVTASNINVFGMPIGEFDMFALEKMRRARMRKSVGVLPRTSFLRTANREFSSQRAAIVSLPGTTADVIQYLDPAESNFGTFVFMPDYDPVP